MPFRQFVVKLHSRCDLACDHCYIYEHEDTQWRGRPPATPSEVLARTAERIAEHAEAHQLATVHVVLHGGEPLLAGPEMIETAARELGSRLSRLDRPCSLDLRIHTNGVLLDRRFCELFLAHGIKVGISLDGGRAANDLHRRYRDGRSSYDKVLRAVALLQEPRYQHLFAGLLCTIDVRNDPLDVYEALMALNPPRLDFLLPHATWEHPPLRPEGPESTPYAAWLGAVYDRWDAEGRRVPVRTFESVLRTLRGESSLTENLGLEPADLVVVETDGTLEQADSLRTAFDGAAGTGFNVFDHDFDQAARHPGMIDRQLGLASLSATCRSCPVVGSCGGGLYAHRYRKANGFDNPSVFCGDLKEFITKVAGRQESSTVDVSPELGPVLTDDLLGELAAGYGGTEAVGVLAGKQLEINRLLFGRAASSVGMTVTGRLVHALDAEAPEAFDQVLAHPYTRTWAARGGRLDDGLAEFAAAVALRAGADTAVRVPAHDGAVRLPGLGRLLVDAGVSAVTVQAAGDGFTARTDAGTVVRIHRAEPDPCWQPVREVAAGPDWSVLLEDTDPYRESHEYSVSERLTDAELAAWTGGLTEAWELINRILPGYAAAIATGLSVITPLRRTGEDRDLSSSVRSAFGAVGIARPASSETLALLLVHEFQHVKLGAVLDHRDLFDADDARWYQVGWRDDLRPLEGVFQGVYAHLAVTEYWRARWHDLREQGGGGAVADHAEREFTRWLGHTAQAVETLAGSGSLTELGRRFTAGMRASVEPWLDEVAAPVLPGIPPAR